MVRPVLFFILVSVVLMGQAGGLPNDPKERALLHLKDPAYYFKDFSQERFKYDSHECHALPSSLVCTACYKHPKRLLGQISIECPNKPKAACELLLLPADFKPKGVDPAYCEKR